MGMDLYSVGVDSDDDKSFDDAVHLGYNWTGWGILTDYLQKWGVDICEFVGLNDGDPISAGTCFGVAEALEANFSELPPDHQRWLADHAKVWRQFGDLGGCEQH